MNLQTRLTLCTGLLVLVISVVPVRSADSAETSSETSVDRVKRRSYYPWAAPPRTNSVSLYEASSTFRAAPYTVPRPYYIPVYGAAGRPLIFYPPQPLYVNPGTPQDNPLVGSYGAPGYLPPKESPHFVNGGEQQVPPKERPATTSVKPIKDRFDTDDEDVGQDDPNAPVWLSSGNVIQMPLSSNQIKESDAEPTRAPMTRPTQPPLVHGTQPSGQSGGFSAQAQPTVRPVLPGQIPQEVQRPTLRTTTPAPIASGPSNCVWAIISCCTASNPKAMPQNCFEQRGCPGPFWGTSPCEGEYARAAIAAAMNYYNTNPRNSLGK